MYFSSAFFASTVLLLPTFVTPSCLVNVTKYAGETNGQYVVTFKFSNATLSFANGNNKVHCYKIINGCAGKFTDKEIQELQANPDVEGIYEDGLGKAAFEANEYEDGLREAAFKANQFVLFSWSMLADNKLINVRYNATWGLARLSSKDKLKYKNVTATDFPFHYFDDAGEGIDIYIVDSGVYLDHTDFGGRAKWGATFVGKPGIDGYGHGTCGLAAGATYGVAKKANIIAVKVMDEKGVDGLDYIYKSAKASGHPSVVCVSLVVDPFQPLDDAVVKLTNDDILLVAAAGNQGKDANLYSPGRCPQSITIAATNIEDGQRASSNHGLAVFMFAPGEDIISTSIEDKHATSIGSGTSASAAYVAGIVATIQKIVTYDPVTVSGMKYILHSLSLKNKVQPISKGKLTPNRLAQNGFKED
ncbi:hypothetical protein C0995_015631 [Termitomyces sp. Mi166|nr:hypothetical protein C0995_015631 [Termitomyces sp. Mi166\